MTSSSEYELEHNLWRRLTLTLSQYEPEQM